MFTSISKSTKQNPCSLHAQSAWLIDPFQQPCDLGHPNPTLWLPRPRPSNGTGQRSYVGEQVDRDLQAPELLKNPWGTAGRPLELEVPSPLPAQLCLHPCSREMFSSVFLTQALLCLLIH